jgi:uncharacterized zinc-type alcohol dehydrogenase-like protein
MPGHEIVGRVTAVGDEVAKFKVGDIGAVGCMVDSCQHCLRRDGTLCLIGAPEHPHPSPQMWNFLLGRRSLAGSGIGGMPETQEMLDFCAEKSIVSDIEMIPIQDIEKAYERLLKGDVRYRFVIDSKTLQDA